MILITGATGLVGSHLLLDLLESGRAVRALYRTEARKQAVRRLFAFYGKEALFADIQWLRADITDIPSLEPAFDGIAHVYHCAALISFNPDDENRLRKVNIEGTANIVNLCLARGVRKLCHISSVAALGDLNEGETVNTEASDWNPERLHNDYAISKYGAEMEVWRGQQEGLSTVILNPGIIIGPMTCKSGGTAELFARIENGQTFYTLGKTAVVAVDDVVRAAILLMGSGIEAEKFILSAENHTYRDLMVSVADALGTARPKYHAQKWMTSLAWRADWLLSATGIKRRTLSKAGARSLHAAEEIVSDKIRSQVGFTFSPLSDAIAQAAAFWKIS